jgi:hypothetical protein
VATFGTFADNDTLKATELNDLFRVTSFNPVVRQDVTLTLGGSNTFYGRYFRVNKMVHVVMFFDNQIVGGTTNNRIDFNLPVTAASRNIGVIGSGWFLEKGVPDKIVRLAVVQFSTTAAALLANDATSTTNYLGLTGTAVTKFDFNERLACVFSYEAA